MSNLEIRLDKASFKAGEVVNGQIDLNLTEGVKAKYVVVEIHGGEHTRITRTHQSGKTSVTRTYTEEVRIIDKKSIVTDQIVISSVINSNGDNNLILPSGRHSASFSFTLPEDATPSYNGEHASVKYDVSAKVDIPWKSDINNKKIITIRPADAQPEEGKPVKLEEKSGRRWLPQFLSPKIGMVVELNKANFVRREYIEGKVKATNSSGKEIENVVLNLYAREHAEASIYTENSIVMRNSLEIPVSQPKINYFEQDFKFRVPYDIIPTLSRKYFSIEWYFEIGLDVRKASDISVREQLIIK